MPSDLPAFHHPRTFQWTQPPDPSWKPGDGLGETESAKQWRADEEQGWKTVDPAKLTSQELYYLSVGGIVPRPIAFVSSLAEDGTPNLAPFSWFNTASHNPPMIMFSAGALLNSEKDTAANIRATKEFTVNIISVPWANAANFTSVDAPKEVSEWAASGLRMEKSSLVKPAWVKESGFAMECELFQIVDIPFPDQSKSGSPKIANSVIFGLVKLFHIRNAVLGPDGVVDPGRLNPLVRIGSISYAKLGDGFSIPRPRWADAEDEIMKLEAKGKASESN